MPEGAYRGEHPIPAQAGADPLVLSELRRVVLEIGADGNAKLKDGGIPWEGRMTREGDDLRFEVLAIAGVNVEKQPTGTPRRLEFRLLSDGRIRFGDALLQRE